MATLPVVAIAAATTTLVGQNLGAHDRNRAKDSALKSLLVSSVVMIFFSFLFFGMAYPLIAIFTPHTQIRALGEQFLKIMSFSQIFAGATIALGGVFRGAGDTKPPMLVGLGKLGFLVLLANLFSRYLFHSVTGVWWAINIGTGLEAMVLFWWFCNGKWQEKEISSILPVQE
jgi:Na+-driven multidrug efflux pump